MNELGFRAFVTTFCSPDSAISAVFCFKMIRAARTLKAAAIASSGPAPMRAIVVPAAAGTTSPIADSAERIDDMIEDTATFPAIWGVIAVCAVSVKTLAVPATNAAPYTCGMVSASRDHARTTVDSTPQRSNPDIKIVRTCGIRSTSTPMGIPNIKNASVPNALSTPISVAEALKVVTAITSIVKSAACRLTASTKFDANRGPDLFRASIEIFGLQRIQIACKAPLMQAWIYQEGLDARAASPREHTEQRTVSVKSSSGIRRVP